MTDTEFYKLTFIYKLDKIRLQYGPALSGEVHPLAGATRVDTGRIAVSYTHLDVYKRQS